MSKKIILLTLALISTSVTNSVADVRHRIQAGETLYSISRRYNVTVEALQAANPNMKKYIFAGMDLIIPIDETTTPTSTTTTPATTATTPATTTSTTTTSTSASTTTAKPSKNVDAKISKGEQKFVEQQPVAVQVSADDEELFIQQQAHTTSATTGSTVVSTITQDPASTATLLAQATPDQALRHTAAPNSILLESGSLIVLQQRSATAKFLIDYTQSQIDGTTINLDQYLLHQGQEKLSQWPREAQECQQYFIETFNHKNKKNTKLSATQGINTIILRPEQLTLSDPTGCTLSGTLLCYNTTGELLCQLYLSQIRGLADASYELRLQNVYYEIATQLKKYIKR